MYGRSLCKKLFYQKISLKHIRNYLSCSIELVFRKPQRSLLQICFLSSWTNITNAKVNEIRATIYSVSDDTSYMKFFLYITINLQKSSTEYKFLRYTDRKPRPIEFQLLVIELGFELRFYMFQSLSLSTAPPLLRDVLMVCMALFRNIVRKVSFSRLNHWLTPIKRIYCIYEGIKHWGM